MKKILCYILCILMLGSALALPASAEIFHVSYYSEEIYAGGIMDLYAFPQNGGVEPFTYQWQAQGFGWFDLVDNEHYKDTKTNHMRLYTNPEMTEAEAEEWAKIPFRCAVTDAEGDTFYSPVIYMRTYPLEELVPNMRKWGYGLYEPTLSNVTGLYTSDNKNYSAATYAGSKVSVMIGSTPVENRAVLVNSEVKLTRQIHITENGHTTQVGDRTTYIPYTVGDKAVKIEFKLRLSIAGHDLGDYETKTLWLNVRKPTSVGTASAKSDCSLLRYTYNESQKLAAIPKGATVEVLSKEGSYYQVFYSNFVGYVGASLLNVQQDSYDPVIKDVDVVIPKPVAGQKPSFTCEVLTKGCQLYHTDPISWTDVQTGKFLSAQDTFQEGRRYQVTVWLAAQDGYKFRVNASDQPDLTGAINGDLPPFIRKAYEQDPEKVIELTYTFGNTQKEETQTPPHICNPVLVPRVEPTCTEKGFEAYYRCECGMCYQDSRGQSEVNTSSWGSLPATGHQPSGWRITQVYHYKVCTACGELLGTEDHKGGTATCVERARCTVCDSAYGNPEDHTWSPTWLYLVDAGHAWICARCKIHSEVIPHKPGPAATEKDPQVCTDCGFILTPVKNHTHSLTKIEKIPASCVQGGNAEYYVCSGCSDRFTDAQGKNKLPASADVAVGALGHKTSDTWQCSADYHWRVCTACGVVLDETKMLHENKAGTCTTCGYKSGTAPAQPGQPQPTQPQPGQPGVTQPQSAQPSGQTPPKTDPTAPSGQDAKPEKTAGNDREMLIYILAAVVTGSFGFCAAIITTVIILKKKKR